MAVVFTSIDSISIDGIPAGNIVDVISNHAPRRAEVLAAYRVFVEAEKAKRDETITKLESDKAKLTTDLATATSQLEASQLDKTQLDLQIATLTTEKQTLTIEVTSLRNSLSEHEASDKILQETVTALTNEKAELTAKVVNLTERLEVEKAKVAALEIEVTKLTAIRQYNPRWTTPDYFINRFTAHEAKAFYSSDDPIIVGGRELLEEYEQAKPPYHVDLDDAQVQGLTGYMVQLDILTIERRTQVLRDATAQEAFYPQ